MSTIKVSFLWENDFVKDTVFFHLFKKLSKKKIEITSFHKADVVIYGPFDFDTIKRRFLNFFLRKEFFNKIDLFFPNIFMYSFKRKYQPLKIFYNAENIRHDFLKADFYITPDMGVFESEHLRFPSWKDYIDWSQEGIFRENNVLNAKRFGFFWKQEDLLKPQDDFFLKKKRQFCLFAGHLKEPRRSMYLKIQKYFKVDGFGPYFDKSIKNHNSSNFLTSEIMRDYAFNLCPQNSLFHGYYNESIVNAFLSKTLPVTWADHNIKIDFNPNAFVNLIDDVENNYENICELLKDDSFLKNYAKEPILLKKIDLEQEKIFVERILASL
jgi:hypothetical protein